jgi:hypothetical protein
LLEQVSDDARAREQIGVAVFQVVGIAAEPEEVLQPLIRPEARFQLSQRVRRFLELGNDAARRSARPLTCTLPGCEILRGHAQVLRQVAKIGRTVDGVGDEVLDADTGRENPGHRQQFIADRTITVNRLFCRLLAFLIELGFVLRSFLARIIRLLDALLKARAIKAKRDNQCINNGSGHLLGGLVDDALVMAVYGDDFQHVIGVLRLRAVHRVQLMQGTKALGYQRAEHHRHVLVVNQAACYGAVGLDSEVNRPPCVKGSMWSMNTSFCNWKIVAISSKSSSINLRLPLP